MNDIKFAYWAKGKRLYVNGIDGLDGKLFFKSNKGQAELAVVGAFVGEQTEEKIYQVLHDQHNFNPELMSFDELVKIFKKTPRKKEKVLEEPEKKSSFERRFEKKEVEQKPLDLKTIEMPSKVTVRIDHREPRELSLLLGEHPQIEVSIEALDIGDIIINDKIVIERKDCTERKGATDFENSVINNDKRLFNQSEKMKLQDNTIPIIILEGDYYRNSKRMLTQQIDGAISFLTVIQKISVWTTYDLNHTAYVIAKMARHDKDGLGYEVALRSSKPKNLLDRKSFVLEGIPGISAKMAKTLLAHFGSVRGVMTADKKELLMIKGLGEKRVTEILETLG